MNSFDPGIEQALATVGPRWTTWITQTLQHTGPIVPNDLWRAHLPFVKYPTLIGRLQQMGASGLLQPRPTRAPVALSPRGASLGPVHAALADWSRRHGLLDGAVPEAERTEDALRRLRHKHLLPMTGWLAEHPDASPSQIADGVGIAYISAVYRIDQLAADGLVETTGRSSRTRGTVRLTDAGRDLSTALAPLADWSDDPSPVEHQPVRPAPQTAAAVRRSPAASTAPALPTFSHVETVRPWQRPAPVSTAHRR